MNLIKMEINQMKMEAMLMKPLHKLKKNMIMVNKLLKIIQIPKMEKIIHLDKIKKISHLKKILEIPLLEKIMEIVHLNNLHLKMKKIIKVNG
jgi:hypothetical protein